MKTDKEIIAEFDKTFPPLRAMKKSGKVYFVQNDQAKEWSRKFLINALKEQREPMGASQWKAHGKKYGYDKYFREELAGEVDKIIREIGYMQEYCIRQNGRKDCKNCGMDFDKLIDDLNFLKK